MGRIIGGYTFDDYQKKYGKKFKNGKLEFIKIENKSELNPKKKYWLIEDKKPGYYQVDNFNHFLPLVFLGIAAIVTAIVVPCVLLAKRAREVKVIVPDTSGLEFSNLKAFVGQDFDTEISIDVDKTEGKILPTTLDNLLSGNRMITEEEYIYKFDETRENGSLHIPGHYIEGDVTITLTLVSHTPTGTAVLSLDNDSKEYGKLSYGGKTDYTVDISDKIGSSDFTIDFVPEKAFENADLNITFPNDDFTATYSDKKIRVKGKGTRKIQDKDDLVMKMSTEYFYIKNIGNEDAEISIINNNEVAGTIKLNYSLDKMNWEPVELGYSETETISIESGDIVYFNGENADGLGYDNQDSGTTFMCNTSELSVGGDIKSLVFGTNYVGDKKIPSNCFIRLFSSNGFIVDAKKLILPKSGLSSTCFSKMFIGCEALEYAPTLMFTDFSSDTSECYDGMFNECYALSELKVGFGEENEWPAEDDITTEWLMSAGESAEEPTFYWNGDNDPTSFDYSENTVPDNWTIKHW